MTTLALGFEWKERACKGREGRRGRVEGELEVRSVGTNRGGRAHIGTGRDIFDGETPSCEGYTAFSAHFLTKVTLCSSQESHRSHIASQEGTSSALDHPHPGLTSYSCFRLVPETFKSVYTSPTLKWKIHCGRVLAIQGSCTWLDRMDQGGFRLARSR